MEGRGGGGLCLNPHEPPLATGLTCVQVHSCTCTLCKDSVRKKNPKSLQVVQAQSVCECMCCVCVYVCVCVCDEYGVRAIYITMCKYFLAHVHAL